MLKIRKTSVGLGLGLGHGFVGIVFGFAPLNAYSAEPKAETFKKNSIAPQEDDSVRSVLMDLQAAIASKNIDNLTALFSEDARMIDQSGEEIQGRKALHERLERLKVDSAPALEIHPQSITFPASTVALIIGEVSRKRGPEDLPMSRFSMVMVKRDNKWLISELQETTMQVAQTESHLQELDWLIGHWTADRTDASAQVNFEWTPDKKFMKSKCIINRNGAQPQEDTQVIGWDPQHNAIISWHFDSNGGFGNGTWSQQAADKKWTVCVAGVGADGSNSIALNVFTVKSADEFIWQSIHRTLDGDPVADTAPITLHRVKL